MVVCPVVKWRGISTIFLFSSFYIVLLWHYIVSIYHKGLLVITLNLHSDEREEKEKYTNRSLVIMVHKIIRQFRKLLVGNCPSCIKIILIVTYRVQCRNDCRETTLLCFPLENVWICFLESDIFMKLSVSSQEKTCFGSVIKFFWHSQDLLWTVKLLEQKRTINYVLFPSWL